MFSSGLLQINFFANYTLLDKVDPVAEEAMYLRAPQAAKLIQNQCKEFNVFDYDPDVIGKNSYQSDALKTSKMYYKKFRFYVDNLFESHKESWEGKIPAICQFIYK